MIENVHEAGCPRYKYKISYRFDRYSVWNRHGFSRRSISLITGTDAAENHTQHRQPDKYCQYANQPLFPSTHFPSLFSISYNSPNL